MLKKRISRLEIHVQHAVNAGSSFCNSAVNVNLDLDKQGRRMDKSMSGVYIFHFPSSPKYESLAGRGKNMTICYEKARILRGKGWKNEKKVNFHCILGKRYHLRKLGEGQKYHILGKYSPQINI